MYGFPEEHNKRKTWNLLQDICRHEGKRLVCFGDFNDTLYDHENLGGKNRTQQQLSWERQTLEVCELIDLGFVGYPFTWMNGIHGSENIQCMVDRCVASNDFINHFAPIKVSHLSRYGSDHAVVSLSLEEVGDTRKKKKVNLFRFEDVYGVRTKDVKKQ